MTQTAHKGSTWREGLIKCVINFNSCSVNLFTEHLSLINTFC